MRTKLGLICVAGLVVGVAVGAAAQTLTIPIETVVRAPEGSHVELAVLATPPESVGLVCTVVAEAVNQSSVHPGNDLIVSSGAWTVVLADVEAVPGKVTGGSGTITLGPAITVTLAMGPDGVFSGGGSVEFTCQEPTTTTSEPVTTTTRATTTTAANTTTTIVAPTTTARATTTTTQAPATTAATTTTTVGVAVLPASAQLPETGLPIVAITALGFGLLASGLAIRRGR